MSEKSTNSNKIYMYLYAPNDDDSEKILNKIRHSGINNITCLPVDDEKTIQHLKHNQSGYSIHELPCFVVRQSENPVCVYSYQDVDLVLSMASLDFL